MKSEDLLRELRQRKVVLLDADHLEELLESSETIGEHDTTIAGLIRILRFHGLMVVQESPPRKREIALRKLDSLEEAERFVEERLAAYERMWDGCGCSINYYS